MVRSIFNILKCVMGSVHQTITVFRSAFYCTRRRFGAGPTICESGDRRILRRSSTKEFGDMAEILNREVFSARFHYYLLCDLRGFPQVRGRRANEKTRRLGEDWNYHR
jgi:hypothetical protein